MHYLNFLNDAVGSSVADNLDLSIIVPAYNEQAFIGKLLVEISSLEEYFENRFEIIVVDDCSTDETKQEVKKVFTERMVYLQTEANSGKGAAVQLGVSQSKGRYVLVQDADLEYSPRDIPRMYSKVIHDNEVCVYGSRVKGAKNLGFPRNILRLWPRQNASSWLFNVMLSVWFFAIHRQWLTDLLTGYKLYPRSLFLDWKPITKGFETDHEITSIIMKLKMPIIEIPISYSPRSKLEGKKIRAKDGFIALRTFWRYRK